MRPGALQPFQFGQGVGQPYHDQVLALGGVQPQIMVLDLYGEHRRPPQPGRQGVEEGGRGGVGRSSTGRFCDSAVRQVIAVEINSTAGALPRIRAGFSAPTNIVPEKNQTTEVRGGVISRAVRPAHSQGRRSNSSTHMATAMTAWPMASYAHDFTATKTQLILILQPWVQDRMVMPYVDSFTWRTDRALPVSPHGTFVAG